MRTLLYENVVSSLCFSCPPFSIVVTARVHPQQENTVKFMCAFVSFCADLLYFYVVYIRLISHRMRLVEIINQLAKLFSLAAFIHFSESAQRAKPDIIDYDLFI